MTVIPGRDREKTDPGHVKGEGKRKGSGPAHDWQEGLDVKIKTRPKHGGTHRMNGWLAGLRDGESARPVGAARGAASPSNRNPGRAGRGYAPLSQAELEWHHDYQADEAYPRWQMSGKPSRYIDSPAMASNLSRA